MINRKSVYMYLNSVHTYGIITKGTFDCFVEDMENNNYTLSTDKKITPYKHALEKKNGQNTNHSYKQSCT